MGRPSDKKPFIHKDFLLETDSARILYHNYAKDLPIIDYHNHLSPKAIAENKIYDSITALWLDGDHYKWRALRALGIAEKYITGKASDKEKFKGPTTVSQSTARPIELLILLESSILES